MNYKGYCKSCKKDVPMSIAHMSRRKGIKLKYNLCLSVQTRYMGKRKLEEFKMNTLTKFGGNNTMKFKDALEKAKSIAFKDYDDECKDYDEGYNATRTWDKLVREDGAVVYSLSGTPPKAYLVVFPNKTTIHCKRTLQAPTFKTIDFEGEPSGSPSLGGNK